MCAEQVADLVGEGVFQMQLPLLRCSLSLACLCHLLLCLPAVLISLPLCLLCLLRLCKTTSTKGVMRDGLDILLQPLSEHSALLPQPEELPNTQKQL